MIYESTGHYLRWSVQASAVRRFFSLISSVKQGGKKRDVKVVRFIGCREHEREERTEVLCRVRKRRKKKTKGSPFCMQILAQSVVRR